METVTIILRNNNNFYFFWYRIQEIQGIKITMVVGKIYLTCLPVNEGWIICTKAKWSSRTLRSGKVFYFCIKLVTLSYSSSLGFLSFFWTSYCLKKVIISWFKLWICQVLIIVSDCYLEEFIVKITRRKVQLGVSKWAIVREPAYQSTKTE